ncbi:trypsin-1-like [Convolutriloba macropyga]|uniref:trypsin-1-like n=1 Tax=Convolutriloba macropyga TaxID=536237 RepID=UPI003F527514
MNRIVNGKPVDIKDYPFMVHMRFEVPNGKVKQCGAAILSETAVVTAKHCLKKATVIWLSMGAADHKKSENQVTLDRESIQMHPDSNIDLALLMLPKDKTIRFVSGKIQPLPLPPDGFRVQKGQTVTVSGWGYKCSNPECKKQDLMNSQLHAVDVPVKDGSECQPKGDPKAAFTFCAGGMNNGNPQDACSGDSGSPTVCRLGNSMFLCGVVSSGPAPPECGVYPGTYVDITVPKVIHFIRSTDKSLQSAGHQSRALTSDVAATRDVDGPIIQMILIIMKLNY